MLVVLAHMSFRFLLDMRSRRMRRFLKRVFGTPSYYFSKTSSRKVKTKSLGMNDDKHIQIQFKHFLLLAVELWNAYRRYVRYIIM